MNQADEVKTNLTMNFDARDVIDVLVSDQEQSIEKQIESLTSNLENLKEEVKKRENDVDEYIKNFVKRKYGEKILSLQETFKDLGTNSTIRIEPIDGCDLPGRRRPILTMNPEHEDKSNKIIVALIICNKEFDRNTVDGSITFYLESEYDEDLKAMKSKNEDLYTQIRQLTKNISDLEVTLSKTDRLVRKAKASITKKAIGKDISKYLDGNQLQEIQQITKKED